MRKKGPRRGGSCAHLVAGYPIWAIVLWGKRFLPHTPAALLRSMVDFFVLARRRWRVFPVRPPFAAKQLLLFVNVALDGLFFGLGRFLPRWEWLQWSRMCSPLARWPESFWLWPGASM